MKKPKIVLCIFLAFVILLCLLSTWRDISVYVPQRLAETGKRVEKLAEEIASHFVGSLEETFREVNRWYDELVS